MEDLHKIWHHRWLNPKVKSFDSPVSGKGIIAVKPISKGEIIVVLGGIIVPKSDILKYRKTMGHIGTQIHDNFFIVPTTREELNETGSPNHSCNPNIGFDGPIFYVAMRDINIGEELLLDHAFMESFFEPFKCNCSSKNCRNIITPDDWKIPELQKKYGEYFSPYLKKKFAAEVDKV